MDLDEVLGPEAAMAAAATALIASPRVRALARQAAVLGLSRLFAASDALSAAAQDLLPGGESSSVEEQLADITARPAEEPEGSIERP